MEKTCRNNSRSVKKLSETPPLYQHVTVPVDSSRDSSKDSKGNWRVTHQAEGLADHKEWRMDEERGR